jgi:DNA-binding transcriptional regulator YiaG
MQNQSIQLLNITTHDLTNLIKEGIKSELTEFKKSINPESLESPHLTRRQTAEFFGVSLNCVNDWERKGILKGYKVGQRKFFKRSELMQVMFNQKRA